MSEAPRGVEVSRGNSVMPQGNSVIMHNTFLEVRGRTETVVGEFEKRNSAPPRVFGSVSRTSLSCPPVTRTVAAPVTIEAGGYTTARSIVYPAHPAMAGTRRLSQGAATSSYSIAPPADSSGHTQGQPTYSGAATAGSSYSIAPSVDSSYSIAPSVDSSTYFNSSPLVANRSVTLVQSATARASTVLRAPAAPTLAVQPNSTASLTLPAAPSGLPLQHTLGLPVGLRARTRTNTGPRCHAGSFDVPMTPESRWYPNAEGAYNFGMPASPQSVSPAPSVQTTYAAQAAPATMAAPAPGTVLRPLAGGVVSSQQLGNNSAVPYPAGEFTQNPNGVYSYNYAQMPQESAVSHSQDNSQAQWARMPNGVYVQVPSQAAMGQSFQQMQQQMGQYFQQQGVPNNSVTMVQASAQRLRLASLVGDVRPQQDGRIVRPQQDDVRPQPEDGPITTVMLRNIPLKYTRDTLMQDLAQRGFGGTYDFFYLPIDFQSHYSVGYAFINFNTEPEARRFRTSYEGLRLADDSLKVCEVCNAKVQGRDRNVEQYRNSAVMTMEEQYHPVILQNGMRLPFPAPTHAPKPFRPRRDRRQQQQQQGMNSG